VCMNFLNMEISAEVVLSKKSHYDFWPKGKMYYGYYLTLKIGIHRKVKLVDENLFEGIDVILLIEQ
jgi:hypothetical protein